MALVTHISTQRRDRRTGEASTGGPPTSDGMQDGTTPEDAWRALDATDEWRACSIDDLVGVAEFLAGNVLAHRAGADEAAQALVAWTDGRTDLLEAAAHAVAADPARELAHQLLRRALDRGLAVAV